MSGDVAWGVPPNHELPHESKIGGVRLLVSDLERSRRFYQDIMGLQLHDRSVDAAVLGTKQAPLVRLESREGVVASRKGAFGLYHFAILLPDRASLGRFAAHAIGAGVRLGMADHLVSEALYLSDPDGLGIEVYADKPEAEWRQRGRELVMTVDPLDLESVLDAGGHAGFRSAPDATTMGHVHLHVGDLSEAERFYHHGVGFRKTLWSFPGALFLAAGSYHHHLGTNTWAPGPAPDALEARLLEWEIIVPDEASVAAVAGSLREQGFATTTERDALFTSDPWHTGLRVMT